MDVGEHAPRGDRNVRQQLVELLVVPDCQLDVARGDSLLLVVPAGVSGQLQDLGAQVCALVCGLVVRVVDAVRPKTARRLEGLVPSAVSCSFGVAVGVSLRRVLDCTE